MRVVPDTNGLISGIFFAGPPARILVVWAEGRFDLLVTVEVLTGYRRVAKRLGRLNSARQAHSVRTRSSGLAISGLRRAWNAVALYV